MDRRVLVKDDACGRLLALHLEQSGDEAAPRLIIHAHAFNPATSVFATSEKRVVCDLPVPKATYGTSELLAAAFVDDDGLGMHMLFLVLFLHAHGHVALVRVSPHLSAVDDLALLEVAAWHNHRCHARLVDGPRILLYSSSSKAMQLLAWNSDEDDGKLQPLTGEMALPATTLGMPQCQRIGTHLLLHTVLPDDVHVWETLPLWPLPSPEKRVKRDIPDVSPCAYLPAPTTSTTTSVYIRSSDDSRPTHLFVGTMAPSLVAYRYNCVVASLQLPGPAIDIQHAAVDATHGVLAVLCNDAQQTLLIVSAHDDTLTIVQEIALVDRVLIADFKGTGRDQLLCLSEQSVDDILGRWLLTDLSYVHTDPAKDKKVKKRKAKTKLHVQLDKMMPPDRSQKLLAIEQAMVHKAAQATADNTRLGRFVDEKKRLLELLYQHCAQTVDAQAAPEQDAPKTIELLALETVLPGETPAPAAVISLSSLRRPSLWMLKHWEPVAAHHTPTSMVVDVALTVLHRASDVLTDVAVHAVSSSSLGSVSAHQPSVVPGAECNVVLQLALSYGVLEMACDLCIAYTDVGGGERLFQPLAPLAIGTADLFRLRATVPRPDVVADLIVVSPHIDLTQAVPVLQAAMPERIEAQLLRPSIASLCMQSHSRIEARLMRAHLMQALDGCTVLTSPFSRTHMEGLQSCMRALRKELAFLQGSASVDDLRSAQIQLDVAMGHLHKALTERAETSGETRDN